MKGRQELQKLGFLNQLLFLSPFSSSLFYKGQASNGKLMECQGCPHERTGPRL